jgi:hypothetical protein
MTLKFILQRLLPAPPLRGSHPSVAREAILQAMLSQNRTLSDFGGGKMVPPIPKSQLRVVGSTPHQIVEGTIWLPLRGGAGECAGSKLHIRFSEGCA